MSRTKEAGLRLPPPSAAGSAGSDLSAGARGAASVVGQRLPFVGSPPLVSPLAAGSSRSRQETLTTGERRPSSTRPAPTSSPRGVFKLAGSAHRRLPLVTVRMADWLFPKEQCTAPRWRELSTVRLRTSPSCWLEVRSSVSEAGATRPTGRNQYGVGVRRGKGRVTARLSCPWD